MLSGLPASGASDLNVSLYHDRSTAGDREVFEGIGWESHDLVRLEVQWPRLGPYIAKGRWDESFCQMYS